MPDTTHPAARTHPLILGAAVAVIVFSATGVAALAGWLPGASSQSVTTAAAPNGVNAALTAPVPVGAAPAPTETPKAEPPAAPKVEHKTATPQVRHATVARTSAPAPAPTRTTAPAEPAAVPAQPPAQVPAPVPPQTQAPVYRACPDCAVVETVREVAQAGTGTGVGAIGGAVAGGVLGHQVGNGRGQDVATVLGAIGGAIAGHQVEKQVRKTASYEIVLRMEDGSTRVLAESQPPVWRPGDRVRVSNGVIRPAG
jgi:outer membrane lipoprotein SlyB